MTAIPTIQPSTSGDGAPDRRLTIHDEQWRDFSRTIWTGDLERPNEVECQAFATDQSATAIVMLVTRINERDGQTIGGSAEIMLSSAEARIIAEHLIVSANEADVITREKRDAQRRSEAVGS